MFSICTRLHAADALGAVNHDAVIAPYSCLHIGHTFPTYSVPRLMFG